LFALDAKQRQPRGVHAQLLLLDRTHIDRADAVTRLRQRERALVVGHRALEKLLAFRQGVSSLICGRILLMFSFLGAFLFGREVGPSFVH